MRVLVTGFAGFQGSNLSKRLLELGHEVVGLNTFSERALTNIQLFDLDKVIKVWGSITDQNNIDKTVRDCDCVVHMAANIHVDESIKEPRKYFETNVLGTLNILEKAKERNISVLHVSSCEVYGNQDGRILDENAPFCSNSPYAASKAASDVLCTSYARTYNTNICIARPFNVFGVGQRSGKRGAVIPRWIDMALKGQDITVYGEGNQIREFIYIDDLVDAYCMILQDLWKYNLQGREYNIGSNQNITMIYLAEKIIKLTNSKSRIVHLPPRAGEVKSFIGNSDRIRNALGWYPKFNIDKGLVKFIEWAKNNSMAFHGE